MSRVTTNTITLQYAIQQAKGTLGGSPSWKLLEPNGSIEFGATIDTTPRSPISKNRQRRKGTITDLDSSTAFDADLTMDSLLDFAPSFCFVTAENADLVWQGADVDGSGVFTIPAATAAQAAKLQWVTGAEASLVYASGYANAANNGMHVLTADTASSGTSITCGGSSTVAETAPANSKLQVAGIRASAGDISLSVSSGVGTLASAADIDFTTLGLTVGQFVHVGGLTSTNQFGSTAAADGTRSVGYARITAIAASALTLDKLSTLLVASDGTDDGNAGTNIAVDILFGQFIRNVSVDASEYAENYIQFELYSPDLFLDSTPSYPDGCEYALDNLANEMQLSWPGQDKATVTFAFVGTDTEDPVNNNSRKTNADSAIEPLETSAFNTSSEFVRLRITDTDETGLTTDFKDFTLTLGNNVTPEKVLGTLGAAYINVGNFEVTLEGTVLFSNAAVPARIRSNTTVTFDCIMKNDDGGFALDIPSMTLGSGGRDYPTNESVTLSLTGLAFQDTALGTSLGVSTFPALPA